MKTPDEIKLKPCPFCGGEAEINVDHEEVEDTEKRHWAYTVVCNRCCATSGLTYLPAFGCAFRKMDAVVVLQQKVASIDASNGIKVLAQVRIGLHPILDESAIADFIELCNTVHT